jgi:hypothetical protein
MDAATMPVTLDETADLQEQVRTLNLSDGTHTIATYLGVAIAAQVEGGKVVEYIANLSPAVSPTKVTGGN